MPTHPYLRAFLAGVFFPALVMPVILATFIFVRIILQVPIPMERAIIFPMALAPVLWGLWNMLWLATKKRTHLPLQIHGILLPFLLLPSIAFGASALGMLALQPRQAVWFHTFAVPYGFVAATFAVILVIYYMVWRYIVGWMNRFLGVL